MKTRSLLIMAALFIILLFSGCNTVPESIDADLAPIEFFQLGQEASNKTNYEAALLYYQTFIDRFPEDAQRIVEAEFEIANIYYKLDDLQKADEMFTAILEKYNQPGADVLPAWPKILSEKQLATVQEKSKEAVE
ncbi:MAG: tetratricopeptide repeat protein [Spirochaetales bacterium]|nr:tetratricopeptide repeat protein [Spirochaetales bacterium]